jgi:hypothetical protein
MDPHRETRLWPHQNDEIYQAFDRIFDCRGHGWSNLQSTHINFPFQSDADFARVHAACRIILPLLPVLAASSPFWEGKKGPALDTRLVAYESNCARVPSVSGQVIPDAYRSEQEYQALLHGIYADLAPLDPDGILAHEWVNARGIIARFDRGAVEIRVLDAQECPEQDLGLVYFTTELVRALAEGEYGDLDRHNAVPTRALKQLLDRSVSSGREALLDLGGYSELFGCRSPRAGDLLRALVGRHVPRSSPFAPALDVVVDFGNLAERLTTRLPAVSRDTLEPVYRQLCTCLAEGRAFVP